MANFTLTARASDIGNLSKEVGISIVENAQRTLFSLAPFQGKEEELEALLQSAFALNFPKIGSVASSPHGDIYSLAKDQWMLDLKGQGFDILSNLRPKLKDVAALTDQSDSWVSLQLSGEYILRKLEHICPIDLHNNSFPCGSSARTIMDHIGVVIIRGEDTQQDHKNYSLLAATSYRLSLLHMLGV